MSDADALNLATAFVRVVLGAMIFAHGWRHLAAVRSGPGMANWFESLGLSHGKLQAWNVTLTELAAGPALVLGLFTPFAYGGLASILFVAGITNHRTKGFFINAKQEGWEYVGVTGAVALALGVVGPGEWSLDHAFDFAFPFDPSKALAITALLGIAGTALFLGAFWRPSRVAKSAS